MDYTQNRTKNKVFLNYLMLIFVKNYIFGPCGPFAFSAEGSLGAFAFFAGACLASLSSATLAFQQVLSTSRCGALGSAAAAFNNSEILASSMTNLPGLSFPANQDFCRHFDLGEHTVSTLNTPMVSKKLQKFIKKFGGMKPRRRKCPFYAVYRVITKMPMMVRIRPRPLVIIPAIAIPKPALILLVISCATAYTLLRITIATTANAIPRKE